MQARNHAYMHHHTHTTHKHTITHNTITHNTHAQAHHHWHVRCEMLKNPFHPNLACNLIRLKDDWRYFTALQVTVAMVGLWWILLVCRMPNLAQQRKDGGDWWWIDFWFCSTYKCTQVVGTATWHLVLSISRIVLIWSTYMPVLS